MAGKNKPSTPDAKPWKRKKKQPSARRLSAGEVLLEGTHELLLLGGGLESTVTELGRGIDPLEADLLESTAGGVSPHGFAEGHDALLDTRDRTLEHDEVVVDLTVADEATERSNLLLGDVELGGGRVLSIGLANSVDLVVGRGTVVVTHLTSTGNGPLDVVRVPGTDTSNLAETLVSLAGELLGAPTGSDTVETVTLGDGNDVNHLVLLEDGVDGHGLLEQVVAELDLVLDGATVDLDLHQVSLLLLERGLADLGVGKDTDDGAVLLHALKLTGDGRARGLRVLLGVLGEGLLLGLVPVLVEAALDFVRQVLGPDGGERAETAGGLDVANETDNNHGRGVDNGDSLNNLLLVGLGSGTVEIADNGGHTGLVAHGGGKVDGLLGVILGETIDHIKMLISLCSFMVRSEYLLLSPLAVASSNSFLFCCGSLPSKGVANWSRCRAWKKEEEKRKITYDLTFPL